MERLQEIEMLAKFMGFEGQHEEWCGNNIEVEDQFSETGKSMAPYEPDKCYNQLFEIVERIESNGYFHSVYSNAADKGQIYSSFSDSEYKGMWEASTASPVRINAIYGCVVKMVDYLNKQNK
jgi:hypothetical protein